MKRRDFIATSFLSALALSLPRHSFATDPVAPPLPPANDHGKFLDLLKRSRGNFAGLSMTGVDPTIDFIHNRQDGDFGAVRPGVAFFNDAMEHAVVDVPVFPHSVEQNPDSPNRVMLIPRRGKKCVEFDVVENRVTAELDLGEKSFYGHGCYVPGTTLFYAASFLYNNKNASIVLFDYKTGKMLRELEIPGGAGAHQCALSYDRKYVIMTLSERSKTHAPSILWYELKTGLVHRRVYGMREHAEHFSDLADGYLIYTGGVQSKDVETVIGSIDPEKNVSNFSMGENFREHFSGLSVSICGLETRGLSFMTNLGENSLYIIDYKTGKLVKRVETPAPRGLSLSNDGKLIFVTSLMHRKATQPWVRVYDVESFRQVAQFSIPATMAYSSHSAKFRIA